MRLTIASLAAADCASRLWHHGLRSAIRHWWRLLSVALAGAAAPSRADDTPLLGGGWRMQTA